jgi:hypothetical protein
MDDIFEDNAPGAERVVLVTWIATGNRTGIRKIGGADRKIPQPGARQRTSAVAGADHGAAWVMVTVKASAWSWRMWLRALRSVSMVEPDPGTADC